MSDKEDNAFEPQDDLSPEVRRLIALASTKRIPHGARQKWEKLLRRVLAGGSYALQDARAFLLSCRDKTPDGLEPHDEEWDWSRMGRPEAIALAGAMGLISLVFGLLSGGAGA